MEKTELIISIVFALLFLFCIALIMEGEITNYKKNKKKMKKTEFDQMMKNSFADRVVNIPSKTDNQIIAEFMGLDSFKDSLASLHQGNINVDVDLYKQSQYHSSWDWLMPVVEKCFNKQEEVSDDLSFKLNDALLETNIESLYRVVVEFINQYNK